MRQIFQSEILIHTCFYKSSKELYFWTYLFSLFVNFHNHLNSSMRPENITMTTMSIPDTSSPSIPNLTSDEEHSSILKRTIDGIKKVIPKLELCHKKA